MAWVTSDGVRDSVGTGGSAVAHSRRGPIGGTPALLFPGRREDAASNPPASSLPIDHPGRLVSGCTPVYGTELGAAYVGNSLALLESVPTASVAVVITSPPYALEFKKEYGNVDKADYIDWLLPFAQQIKRILKRKAASS